MFKNRHRPAKISSSSGQHRHSIQQPSCCRKLFCNCEWHVMSHWPGADYDMMRFCRSEDAYLSRICPNGFAVRIYLVFACIYQHTLGEKARSPPQGSHSSVIVVAKITVIAKDSMCHLFPSFHWYVMDGIYGTYMNVSSVTTPPCKFISGVCANCSFLCLLYFEYQRQRTQT